MSQPFIGEIRMVGFSFAPSGWAFCDGSLLAITQNQVLFALIGTTYGGDGQNTFALPNLLGRVPIHQGIGFLQGQSGGSETVTVTSGQLPFHNHPFQGTASSATATSPAGASPATTALPIYATPSAVVATSAGSTADPSGGGQPHDNLMPFLCINFVISLFGIFPSQS